MTADIAAFLSEPAIAVVGVSRSARGFGATALRLLRAKGWRCFAVNPFADGLDGERCYPSLSALQDRVNAALVVVPPASSPAVVAECAVAGIRKVWLQRGAECPEALRVAAEHGLSVVAGECILMFAQPRGVHLLHRWITRRRRHAADAAV
jgi:predicted CoA-binding protein